MWHPFIFRRTCTGVAIAVVLLAAILWSRSHSQRASMESRGEERSPASTASVAETAPAGPGAQSNEAEETMETTPPHDNAAHIYKEAFALCSELSEEEKELFRNLKEPGDPDAVAALFEKVQPIMELLRQGAALPDCDWELGAMDVSTLQPQLAKVQELGRMASWEARQRFASDPAGALENLQAATQLGRRSSELLIGALVSASIEMMAVDALRENAAALDGGLAAEAQQWLRSSEVSQAMVHAMEGEAAAVRTTAEKLFSGPPEDRQEKFAAWFSQNPSSDAAEAARLRQIMENPDSLRAQFQHLEEIERQMAEAISWPPPQFQAWRQSVEGKLEEYPLSKMVLPVISAVRDKFQQSQVQREMLATGLALLQGESSILSTNRDPVSGAPFTYLSTENGFELRSSIQNRAKPLSMNFAWPTQ